MDEPSFYEILHETNPIFSAKLDEIKKRAFEEWIHLLQSDAGSHAGYVHLMNVERNANKMIPYKSKLLFSDAEIFLLLSSILLHDIGRIISSRISWKQCSVVKKVADYNFCPHEIYPDDEHCPFDKKLFVDNNETKGRNLHACKSQYVINEIWAILGLPDRHIAQYCSQLTFYHQLNVPPSIESNKNKLCETWRHCEKQFCNVSVEPYGQLRIPLLASILRIADETETCWTRAWRDHWYRMLKDKAQDLNLYKAFRMAIEDIEFCHEAECIIMHVPDTVPEEMYIKIKKSYKEIKAVLDKWGEYLSYADSQYLHVFFERNGKLFLDDDNTKITLAEVFENEGVKLLKTGSTKQIFSAIHRLVRGTNHHKKFRWSSIEGAIGIPLTPKIQWAIEWMGKVHPGLRIVNHKDKDIVEIILSEEDFLTVSESIVGKS
ncbi:MAG: HD domain-containing protein [Paludibacter sp.]